MTYNFASKGNILTGENRRKRQKRTLEIKPSLTTGLSVLFASTGKISVLLLR